MSTVNEQDSSIPEVNSDTSRGSSVSSAFVNEYEELLKYAIVAPRFKVGPDVYDEPKIQDADSIGTNNGISQTPLSSIEPASTRNNSSSHVQKTTQSDSEGSMPARLKKSDLTTRHTVHTVNATTVAVEGKSSQAKKKINAVHGNVLDTLLEYSVTPAKVTAAQPPATTPDSGDSSLNDTIEGSPAVDKDLIRMGSLMDDWCLQLKRNVLAEFADTKTRQIDIQKDEIHTLKQRHNGEMKKLQHEIESLKELLYSFEQNVTQKDTVIQNLTASLNKQHEKGEKIRTFSVWRLRQNDQRREAFACKMAAKHYERALEAKVWSGWRSVVESRWKQRVEKACQAKSQEVCLQLTADYEERIQALQRELETSRGEVARMHRERECYEETMKKAFMRGVCALNMEAMTMFREGQEGGGEAGGACTQQQYPQTANTRDYATVSGPSDTRVTNSAQPSSASTKHVTFSQPPVATGPSSSRPATMPNTGYRKVLNVKATGKKDLGSNRKTSGAASSNHSTISSVMVERHIPNDEMRTHPTRPSGGPSNAAHRKEPARANVPRTNAEKSLPQTARPNLVKVVD